VYGTFLTSITAAVNRWDWGPLSVLWSLAVGEQFYLAAPWIARWIPPRACRAFSLARGRRWVLRSGSLARPRTSPTTC
jgi:peptidoglycan/LPS O-acetylase OafA/YrhL